MICQEMFGNGVPIGMMRIITENLYMKILRDQDREICVSFVAVAGTSIPIYALLLCETTGIL
jgi:hypothetical protein